MIKKAATPQPPATQPANNSKGLTEEQKKLFAGVAGAPAGYLAGKRRTNGAAQNNQGVKQQYQARMKALGINPYPVQGVGALGNRYYK